MRPVFHPQLINGREGDPLLYVDLMYERRALLFDMGDLQRVPVRKLLRISDVFVSHAHMDHFIGFDRWLRVSLGRGRRVRLFGPEGFVCRVAARLDGYSWNLVRGYADDLVLDVHEVGAHERGRRVRFRCRSGFRPEPEEGVTFPGGLLLEEPLLRVSCAVLDHRIPCLAFLLEERRHVNVWKDRLARMDLAPGPWLRHLKQAVLAGAPGDTPVVAPAAAPGGPPRRFALGELSQRILRLVPGARLGYAVDMAYTGDNVARLVSLVRGVDELYIEAVFLQADAGRGRERAHLTAAQAGWIARRAGVHRLQPVHFSPRYRDCGERLEQEARAAFAGTLGTLEREIDPWSG